MDYTEKLNKLDVHLRKHPADYQARICRIKTYSDAVEHERYQRQIERLRNVARYRKERGL